MASAVAEFAYARRRPDKTTLYELGLPTEVPEPSPARAPPYYKSKILRLRFADHAAAE